MIIAAGRKGRVEVKREAWKEEKEREEQSLVY